MINKIAMERGTEKMYCEWGAYDWQGNLIGLFSKEQKAWKYLDQCDMSGNVKKVHEDLENENENEN